MYLYVELNLKLEQGSTNFGNLVAVTTKYFTVASYISGSPVSNLFQVTLPAPIIFRWLLDSWTICAPLEYSYTTTPSTRFHSEYRDYVFTAGIQTQSSQSTDYRYKASHSTDNIPHSHLWINLISWKLRSAATKPHGVTSRRHYPSLSQPKKSLTASRDDL
jgi:hypothetical protein